MQNNTNPVKCYNLMDTQLWSLLARITEILSDRTTNDAQKLKLIKAWVEIYSENLRSESS